MGTAYRKVLLGALVALASLSVFAPSATALSNSGDQALAKTGVLVATDFPAGFTSSPPNNASQAELAKAASGVPSCAAYVALQKLSHAQPRAESSDFDDDTRQVSNTVEVFKSPAAAASALTIYDKSSVPTCLQGLFTKVLTQQFAKDKTTKGKIAEVKVTIKRNPVTGLGNDSVVYEGNARITLKDGSSQQIGIGNAAIQLGRAVSDFTYTTSGADISEVVQPAIDSSIARLQAALTTS